jgi:hypothetical protein
VQHSHLRIIVPINIEDIQSKENFNTRDVEFKQYDKTTQIMNLPGGLKRDSEQIKDDTKPIIRSNVAFNAKVSRDYNSNISCLPCKLENIPASRPHTATRNYQKSDIFNTQREVPVNSFNQCNRNKNIRDFKESGNEKRLIPDKLTPRPMQVKDVFRSQLTIC